MEQGEVCAPPCLVSHVPLGELQQGDRLLVVCLGQCCAVFGFVWLIDWDDGHGVCLSLVVVRSGFILAPPIRNA